MIRKKRWIHLILHFFWRNSSYSSYPPVTIHSVLQLVLVQNILRSKEFNQFCPPSSSNELCLLFCLYILILWVAVSEHSWTASYGFCPTRRWKESVAGWERLFSLSLNKGWRSRSGLWWVGTRDVVPASHEFEQKISFETVTTKQWRWTCKNTSRACRVYALPMLFSKQNETNCRRITSLAGEELHKG